jgi:hypothetical protein
MKRKLLEVFICIAFLAGAGLTTSCASLADVQTVAQVIPQGADIIGVLTPDQLMKDIISIGNGSQTASVYRAGQMYIVTWVKSGAYDPIIVYYNAGRASISEAMIVTKAGLNEIIQAAKTYGFVAINSIPIWLSELGLLTPFYDARGWLQFSAGGGYSLTILICPIVLFDAWMGEYNNMIEPVRVDS